MQNDIFLELNYSALIEGLIYCYENIEYISAEEMILFLRKYLYNGLYL